jgi:hypothetical protein
MDGTDEPLVESFWALSRKLRVMAQEALAEWDVTPSQARALAVLRRGGAQRLGELAEHLRIAPRSATEVVDALAERGLVERRARRARAACSRSCPPPTARSWGGCWATCAPPPTTRRRRRPIRDQQHASAYSPAETC